MQVAEGIGAYWPIQAYRTNFLFFRGRGAGVAGDGDVSDVSDGPALLKNFALLAVCAKGAKLSAKRALGVTDPKREGWARFGCPISENPEMGHPPPQRNYRIERRFSGLIWRSGFVLSHPSAIKLRKDGAPHSFGRSHILENLGCATRPSRKFSLVMAPIRVVDSNSSPTHSGIDRPP